MCRLQRRSWCIILVVAVLDEKIMRWPVLSDSYTVFSCHYYGFPLQLLQLPLIKQDGVCACDITMVEKEVRAGYTVQMDNLVSMNCEKVVVTLKK